MKTLILYLALAILLGFATSALAESIAWESCPVSNGISVDSCTVHDLNIQPCGQATSGGLCRLRRGRPITFGVDFTPNFSGGELQTRVIWKHLYMDLPMDESWNDLNPCSSTVCPLTAGTRQNYNRTFTLHYASWPCDDCATQDNSKCAQNTRMFSEGNSTADSTVPEAEVQPCRNTAHGGICCLRTNRTASISVDFTPRNAIASYTV